MKTEVTFYGGIHTIGGVVMSVVYGSHRVLLEIGTAYEPESDVYDGLVSPRQKNRLADELKLRRVPMVDGIYPRAEMGPNAPLQSAEESPLHTAVFISHLHLDHMSCMGMLSDRVDVYLSEAAQGIERDLETVGMGEPVYRTVPYKPMYDRQVVAVGNIRVTPYLLCARSYQDWSFFVETPDLKLHYTGDLMMHGDYKEAVLREMEEVAAKKPRVLVCEATTFMDSTLKMVYGATDVTVEPDPEVPAGMLDKVGLDAEMERILSGQKGLCVINFYQREMADVETFTQVARRQGRELVLEPETAYVASRFFGAWYPVYLPDRACYAENDAPWFRELMANSPRVTPEDIRRAPHKYLLQNSYENALELLSLPSEEGGYLHAGGTPIGDYDPKYQNLMRILARTRFTYVTFFAKNYFSHAYPCQVKYYVDYIDAPILIPSHSENPERLLPGPHGRQLIPQLGVPVSLED